MQARSEADRLWRTAQALAAAARRRQPEARPLPPLLLFTDPERTPDPLAVAARLPAGAGVVYRHFGALDREQTARDLRRLTADSGVLLLIGDDEALAAVVGADGLHLPERRLADARRLRARRPRWLITAAAHSPMALARIDRLPLDAAVLSAVFPSQSPSAGAPLGPLRTAALARATRTPVYALGGVNARTAQRLRLTPVAGLACVEGLAGG